MNLLEHQGKQLLASIGIAVPRGDVADSPDAAGAVAAELGGRVVCKAQITSGKRGKAGGVLVVESAAAAEAAAREILGSDVHGHRVRRLLVEQAVDIGHELYAAVLDDPVSKGPVLLFSTAGGMDIEEVNATSPESVRRLPLDIREPASTEAIGAMVRDSGLAPGSVDAVADALAAIYRLYVDADASLVEVNPLALTTSGDVVALDAKVTIDAASVMRQETRLADLQGGTPSSGGTDLERSGAELGLSYIELGGDVGVLANGAGLTMTTLDAISHFGGRAANFLEIGGDAYTKATPALDLVLSNPNVRSVLVNFCGAFARTDVMTDGVVNAIEELRPDVPISFTIHGTGEQEAIALVRERLGMEPHDLMDDAVREAIANARSDREVSA
ncbi:succinate--CoA ligase subunit beta [Solicola gregarius]|uniref:Acetate--CoA ligase family protein n=1 Tax=Solicola gregarius TaxID=2908642 RepID=A0AA46TNT3_9ACTN|nr:ATP-grasp domain-containing protein [Solicola gregarius]UYM07793.1 acetate--CoA ligase family protein [Solicola gregarius]